MVVTLESAMVVNPFDPSSQPASYKPRSQAVKKADTLEDPLVNKAYELYQTSSALNDAKIPVLSPQQIDLLVQKIAQDFDPDADIRETAMMSPRVIHWAGEYLSMAINKSIENLGSDRFVLSTGDCRMDSLPTYLRKKVILEFNGSIGDSCIQYCKGSGILIHGDAGNSLGYRSKRCDIEVTGNVGKYCGDEASRMNFIIHGDAGYELGSAAVNSMFTVHGDIGENALFGPARNCIIAASRQETFEKLLKYIPQERGHIVKLIEEDGKVIRRVRL